MSPPSELTNEAAKLGGLCSGWEFGPYGSGGGGDVAEVVLGYVGYRCEFLPYFSCGISDGGADFAAE